MIDVERFSECGLAEKGKEEEYLKKIFDDIAKVVDVNRSQALARVMRAMADPTRIKIVAMAKARGKLYECEVVGAFELAQPTASYHLRLLSEAGILAKKREGRMIAYMPAEGFGWKVAERTLAASSEASASDIKV